MIIKLKVFRLACNQLHERSAHSGILRIGFQFFSQTIDVRIDVALITFVVSAPNMIE